MRNFASFLDELTKAREMLEEVEKMLAKGNDERKIRVVTMGLIDSFLDYYPEPSNAATLFLEKIEKLAGIKNGGR